MMIFYPAVEKTLRFLPAIMARYYNCSFYLVGSAQFLRDPRDIDLVVEIPDILFLSMYGDPERMETVDTWIEQVVNWEFDSHIWKMWAKDVSKQGKELTMLVQKQVDFKTQPSSFFEKIKKPRTLLKTIF